MNAIALPNGQLHVPIGDLPDVNTVCRLLGILTPAEAKRLDAIRNAEWVLVRNDGAGGERWPCRHCGVKHQHFTKFCVERPWRGLREGLLGYWQHLGAGDTRHLTPAARQHLDHLNQIFGKRGVPEPLARNNPQTAHAMGTTENDTDIGAQILGAIDPITPERARVLIDRINAYARRPILSFRPLVRPSGGIYVV